jgi:uncharacterized delta-60 repeat protein
MRLKQTAKGATVLPLGDTHGSGTVAIMLVVRRVGRWIGLLALSGIVLAIPGSETAQARAGGLDPTFGTDGQVSTHFDAYSFGRAAAIDSQGRIVVAGTACPGNGADTCKMALARYMPNGRRDTSFGGDGEITTTFTNGTEKGAAGVAIDFEGRIVAVGRSGADFAVARYKPNGGLDSSFGGDGKVTTDFEGSADGANSVAIDSTDRIIAAGYATIPGPQDSSFALARYNPDGHLDASFDGDGRLTTEFDPPTAGFLHGAAAWAVRIDSQGRIVAVGTRHYEDSSTTQNGDFAVARYEPNGSLDGSFSGDGRVLTRIDGTFNYAFCAAIDPQDRIVAAGATYETSHGTQFALVRYGTEGNLDSSFGGDGKVETSVTQGAAIEGVGIDSRGRIAAAGPLALARFDPDGALDRSFSGDGKVRMGLHAGEPVAHSVVIDVQDRIVVGDERHGPSHPEFARLGVARYIADAAPTVSIAGPSRVKTRHRKAHARFSFRADEPATFECELDSDEFRKCSSPYMTQKLPLGEHHFKVRAVDLDANEATKGKPFKIVRR